ncbi:hypothetical protein Psch_01725 [Pelotomaculum schinkii]|uniref:Uncharacterized protein n=1 Tax=Pelotomaculum schinkii TaxID=78350 RepID=A0A4Y7RHE0_9FIRM|nr:MULTISPECIES: hypothetical protein [Pelotomaculum]TEB08170.1 hypothetical protein Psch_01725 [Pelotomaculum schinkii]TEB15116.1 hypothetical protein Psfp_02435 [Pelotomaculum sp. FP]
MKSFDKLRAPFTNVSLLARGVGEIIDVNWAAIAAHDMAYQYPLSQEWGSL